MRRPPLLAVVVLLGGCACQQSPVTQDGGPGEPCAGSCSTGTRCVNGSCWLEDCPGYDCGPTELCLDGRCRAETCMNAQCAQGTACAAGQCLPETCAGVTCAAGEVCDDGQCVDARCIGIICPPGQQCAAGQCWFPACGATPCTGGALCVSGQCTTRSCIGILCPPNRTCVDGACSGCVAGFYQDGPDCLPQKADTEACSFDVQCLSGRCESQECCTGAACRISKMNGEPCAASTECASARCVGGTCCDTACDGGCQGCSSGTCSSLQSGANDPLCNGALCQGGTGCPTSCLGDADCAGTHHCVMGACAADRTLGSPCGRAEECASGFCSGGVCCNTACDGGCQTCLGATPGTCSAQPANSIDPSCGAYLCRGAASCPTSCGSPSECIAGGTCMNNRCTASFALGTPCVMGSECASGYCADGVCCNTDCVGACDACNLAADAGRCLVAPGGSAGSPSCSPYACTGAAASCPATCTADAQCALGHFCAGGQCAPVPVGLVIPWAGRGAPPFGWLIADGSPISRVAEPALFAVLGTRFGAGDGLSTFNLPDLRQRSALGITDEPPLSIGASGGALPHTHSVTPPAHNHAVSYGSHNHAAVSSSHNHDWTLTCNAAAAAPGKVGDPRVLVAGTYSGTTGMAQVTMTFQSVGALASTTSNTAPAATVAAAATPYLAMRWIIRSRDTGALPCGSVWYSGRSSPVPGAVAANGATLPFSDPRGCIGVTFGDAGTGFRVPDLRGRFAIGLAPNGAGSVFGEAGGTLDHSHSIGSTSTHTASLPAHQHPISGGDHEHVVAFGGGGSVARVSGTGTQAVFDFGDPASGTPLSTRNGATLTAPSTPQPAPVAAAMSTAASTTAGPPWLALDPLLLDPSAARPEPGLMAAWSSPTIPPGWLECDGRAVSRTTYAALFAAIGTTFGAGDGSTSFNLPNMSGRMALGRTGSLGATGGSLGHAHSVTFAAHAHSVALPAHTHSIAPHTHSIRLQKDPFGAGSVDVCVTSVGSITSSLTGTPGSGPGGPAAATSAMGGGGVWQTGTGDAPYLALKWLIRY